MSFSQIRSLYWLNRNGVYSLNAPADKLVFFFVLYAKFETKTTYSNKVTIELRQMGVKANRLMLNGREYF